jgi:hypothetical protein
MIELFQHQREIIKDDRTKTGLFLGTGSGKTLTALSLAEGKTLVIAPKTVRDDETWQKDKNKLGKDLELTVISKEDFRLGKYPNKQWDTIIGDEAHFLSGVLPDTRQKHYKPIPKTSQVFEKLYKFIREKQPKRFYLLTATPTRSAMCVWGLAVLLGHKLDFFEFRDRFYVRIKKGYREFFMPKKDKATKELLGTMVRKIGYTGRLEDYTDVPPQTYKRHNVELTREQVKRLSEIETEFPDPLVQITKRHQIENGVLSGDEFSPPEFIKDNKIEVIKDYAIQFPKFVVFARYTRQIEKIKDALKDDYKVLTLTGATKNRQDVLYEANNSPECIIIIQSQISAGYELGTFPVMIFASLDYSVVNRIQSIGRIQRINNVKKNLYITLVAKGGIDEAVYQSIENKEDFAEHIYLDKFKQ